MVCRPNVRQLLEPIRKTKVLSAVVSSSSWLARHGSAYSPPPRPAGGRPLSITSGATSHPVRVCAGLHDKADGLLPYRYTFNAENSLEPNYFTEKVLDAILCECLCFYDGCPNLEAFLDPETFVRVPMDAPEEAIEIISDAIAAGEWSAVCRRSRRRNGD